MLGRFNEILMAKEKQGWLDRPEIQMQSFHDALDFCCLKVLVSMGFHSLGAIEDLGIRMFGFDLIKVLLQWIGFCSFLLPVYIIWMSFTWIINLSYCVHILK